MPYSKSAGRSNGVIPINVFLVTIGTPQKKEGNEVIRSPPCSDYLARFFISVTISSATSSAVLPTKSPCSAIRAVSSMEGSGS